MLEIGKRGISLRNGSKTSEVMVKNFTLTRSFVCSGFKRNLVSVSCLLNMV